MLDIFFKRKNLKIGTFGLLNNPDYREEPWQENISARLKFFDVVCLVCGNEGDIELLRNAFPVEYQEGKLRVIYRHWPFPEWCYDEFPKHLNAALSLVKEQNCDWAVKLDIDTVFHEKDFNKFLSIIRRADKDGKWLVSFSKLQFFLPTFYWVKSNIPLALNLSIPMTYGFDETRYTDLCQPIEWDGKSKFSRDGKIYDIPFGRAVSDDNIYKTKRVSVFNYDYTFRTYDRAVELLYQIEMAHARFWGKGYSGLPIEAISRETAMLDFLSSSQDRYKLMFRKMKVNNHPVFFQKSLRELKSGQWGYDLWGKIDLNINSRWSLLKNLTLRLIKLQ